ncbi:hypothetical protein ACJRO7_021940 [Eucalyptus globulus]|uniref:Uncharacterized protein n=1 Tax=Eucalyptus globulus TaxID=34317 RepID=A0ABD3KME6_EUCGL
MSLFSSLFSCFSDHSDSRVISFEGEGHLHKSSSLSKDDHVKGEAELKKNSSKSKSKPPPIPMAYFPIGSNLSRL